MDRLACIDLPAFPLQLLLRRHPEWAGLPAAVVEADKPQAPLLWINEAARAQGVLPGMRYAAGLSLAAELCADTVDAAAIEEGTALAADVLRRFSPRVEPSPEIAGLFWLDASGLARLHGTPRAWADRIHEALGAEGLAAHVAVGFRRFCTFAIARALDADAGARTMVFRTPDEERAHALRTPLDRLALPNRARDGLTALGIATVQDLLRLPAGGASARFGSEVRALHRAARGEEETPLQPAAAAETIAQRIVLDYAETDVRRLLFGLKRLLDPLLALLVARRRALRELVLELRFERSPPRTERLRPAEATVDARQLLDLLLLRLETLSIARHDGVIEVVLDADGVPATRAQLDLFAQRTRRDPAAAARAFARLRAEFGDGVVVVARLEERHLPEATFSWTPLRALPEARARLGPRTMVRRIYARPLPLPHRPRHEEDGWQLRGREDAPAERVLGPYIVEGGWWAGGAAARRAYHFIRTAKGEWLWAFYDTERRRWFLQGRLE